MTNRRVSLISRSYADDAEVRDGVFPLTSSLIIHLSPSSLSSAVLALTPHFSRSDHFLTFQIVAVLMGAENIDRL